MENLIYGLVVLLGYTQVTIVGGGDIGGGLQCLGSMRRLAVLVGERCGGCGLGYGVERGVKVLVYRMGGYSGGVVGLVSEEIEGMWGKCPGIEVIRLEWDGGSHEFKREVFLRDGCVFCGDLGEGSGGS